MKTKCDKCKRYCNTFDKSRGMACMDFERNDTKQMAIRKEGKNVQIKSGTSKL